MALDGLVIHAIAHELQACVGGRISKIHQPTEHDLIWQIRAQRQTCRLLLSANPTYPRIHVTEKTYANPTEAPMFCMLLRKHCEGGILEAVDQVGMERILRFHIRQRDEVGDISFKTVILELMGRHSNIILLDPATGVILDGIRHVTPAISAYRIVLPGSTYVSPPDQGKQDPLLVEKEAFVQTFKQAAALEETQNEEAEPTSESNSSEHATTEQVIMNSFSGLSPLAAKELAYRYIHQTNGGDDLAAISGQLWPIFSEAMSDIREHRYAPQTVTLDGSGKTIFSVIALTHVHGTKTMFPSISSCLEYLYSDKAERDVVKQRTSDMQRFLQNERNKNIKKLQKLSETLSEGNIADEQRVLGDLLMASLHLLHKGTKEVEVINYYDEAQPFITIPLDPLLTPSENAQRYFKKYNKLKNSVAAVQTQIEQTEQERLYLEGLLQQLDKASLADIEEIREELIEQGYIRNRAKKNAKKKKAVKPQPAVFISSEGCEILVGKNNTQNDYVTNKLAHAGDIWLHTKDIPGSHVIIRSASYGEPTLLEAAQLAAYFSQAKESSQVPVDYTQVRHVHKPNGAKPGFVIYDHQKTLFVTPDDQAIKAMLRKTVSTS